MIDILPDLKRVSQKPNNSFPRSARVSQNFNSSFSRSEVVIPAKAGIQRQRWISAFSGMTRPGGHRAVWFWWRVSVDSRLRGNDENEAGNDENEAGNDETEAGNDGSQRVPAPEIVLRHPLCAGMHTSPEKRTLQLEISMGSHAGTHRD